MTRMWLVLCAASGAVALQRAATEVWGDALCAAVIAWVCLVCAILCASGRGPRKEGER